MSRHSTVVITGVKVIVVLAWIASMSASCGRDAGAPTGPPVIAATIHPLASVAQRLVAGTDATVVCLVPPGLTPHGFEPTPKQVADLARARLVASVGLHFDDWAVSAVRSVDAKGRIEVFRFADALGIESPDDHAGHDHDHAHHDEEHDHGPINPHLWLDPVRMSQFVEKLASKLRAFMPDHAATIEANAVKLHGDLKALDAEYRAALEPFKGRGIITFHNAFDLLAERYGLVVAATLMPIDAPGQQTSKRVADAVKAIQEHKIPTVFAEPQFDLQAANAIRSAVPGVKVLTLDPIGGPNAPERAEYVDLMRYNLRVLVEGLK